MKNNLFEIEYDKIFSPKTIQTLKGKSGESLRQMLGDMHWMTAATTESMNVLGQISQIEEPYKDLLEQLAVQMVQEAYPIIDYANIKIDAKISRGGGVLKAKNMPEPEEPNNNVPIEQADIPEETKRRVINGITQGAAIRGSFGFMLFREYLDNVDESLVEKYRKILKLTFGIYDSDEAIAMMLMLAAQQGGDGGDAPSGGDEEVEYNEEEDVFTIKAQAINFPMLVHEITKGLYEILSLQGFSADKEKNQRVVKSTDVITNEPDDLRFGKFIYDAVADLYNNSEYDDTRVREYLFVELYKLPHEEFIPFVQNAINGELTPAQKTWAQDSMRDINSDLKKDDLPFEI